MTIIDKPGFYTSKAGKCEVVAVKDGYAFGFIHAGEHARYVRVWSCADGAQAYVDALCDHHITGPYVEPRKPVEAWAVVRTVGNVHLFETRSCAVDCQRGYAGARLIHLREVEDEKP